MKNQSIEFIKKRDKLRNYLIMKRLMLKGHTYLKLMGQKTNNIDNAPFNESEVEDIQNALNDVKTAIKDFEDELHN